MSKRIASRKPGWAGFTLIELMVVVTIVSILIAIAVPTYISEVRKSRRTEAKTALLDLAGREERFFNTNNTYSNTPSDLGYTGAAPFSMPVGSGYYKVAVAFTPYIAGAPGTPATYTITAWPITADQLKDTACLFFSLTNTGVQLATTGLNGTGTVNTTTCWQ